MDKIDIKEVVAYSHCPLFYYFKYKADLSIEHLTSSDHYHEVVKKVIYNFYSILRNQEDPRLTTLKRAWGTWWIQKKNANDVLFVTPYSWREGYERFRKLGIQGLLTFWDLFHENPGFPLAVKQTYQVKVSPTLILTGEWELIREIKQDEESRIQLMQFRIGQKKPSSFLLQHDLELTASSYAFYRHFNKQEDDLLVYLFDKGVVMRTQRSINEYTRLEEITTRIYQGIQEELFYPNPTDKCEHCPFKRTCKEWLCQDRGE